MRVSNADNSDEFLEMLKCYIRSLPFHTSTYIPTGLLTPRDLYQRSTIDCREQGWATQSAPPVLLYYSTYTRHIIFYIYTYLYVRPEVM